MKPYETKLDEVREFRYRLNDAVLRSQSYVDDERIFGENKLRQMGHHSQGALESQLAGTIADMNNVIRQLQIVERIISDMITVHGGGR